MSDYLTTGKHLRSNLFVTKMLAYKPANLLKRDSNTSNINKFLRTASSIEHLQWLLSKVMFETCRNFNIKNEKAFY